MNLVGMLVTWFTAPAQWTGPSSIPVRVGEHVLYSAMALGIAAIVAIVAGIALGHLGRGGATILVLANAVRALPTLGVLTLVVIAVGIGILPPLVALVVLAIPPILVHTYEGMRAVDRSVVDAARSMGLTPVQMSLRVEAPSAMPVILLGLRTAAVQVVATATVAAYVGLGGLGRYIFDGLGRRDLPQVVGGSILVATLAILTELCFVLVTLIAVSPGVRRGRVSASLFGSSRKRLIAKGSS